MALPHTPMQPLIGSQLHLDKAALLGGAHRDAIRALLVERGVIFLRDIALTDEEQRGLARQLGDLRLGTVRKEGDEGLRKVSFDEKVNPETARFFFGSLLWHMDGTYDEVPPFATVVRPHVLPPVSHTEFANTYAAYDALSEADKALIMRLRLVHTMQAALFPGKPDCSVEEFAQWCTFPARSHPLVWHHASGRKSLALSTSGSHVEGMHPADSRDLLDRLMHHATADAFVYRHEWRMDDILLWDNTGTMHRARPYDLSYPRVLARFTLNGEEPVTAAA